jgi:hypothetical protein
MFHQDQALRLNEERLRLAAELQAARLGQNKVTILRRILRGIGWIFRMCFKVVRYALNHLC